MTTTSPLKKELYKGHYVNSTCPSWMCKHWVWLHSGPYSW